jgi:WS/DGAT/MGAT family acyltransferase
MTSMVDRHIVAPRTSLNVQVGRNRRLETVRVSLDDVKSVRHTLGGTVNDVVLAGVTGALRTLLQSRGEPVDGLTLKAMCPVSVRDEHEHMQLGNRVSGMFVALPVGDPDPASRLAAIRATTADLKEREQAVGAAFLVGLTDYAAPTLLGLAARVAHRQPFFNLIVTNVPGPQVPLYCMGARMLEAFPIVPLARNLSLVVGILSYCGELHFGLFADRDACADLPVLAGALEDSFAELGKLAGEG